MVSICGFVFTMAQFPDAKLVILKQLYLFVCFLFRKFVDASFLQTHLKRSKRAPISNKQSHVCKCIEERSICFKNIDFLSYKASIFVVYLSFDSSVFCLNHNNFLFTNDFLIHVCFLFKLCCHIQFCSCI